MGQQARYLDCILYLHIFTHILSYLIFYSILFYYVILFYIISCYIMLYHIVSYYCMLHHIIVYHIIYIYISNIISYYITLYCIVLCIYIYYNYIYLYQPRHWRPNIGDTLGTTNKAKTWEPVWVSPGNMIYKCWFVMVCPRFSLIMHNSTNGALYHWIVVENNQPANQLITNCASITIQPSISFSVSSTRLCAPPFMFVAYEPCLL